MSVSKTKLNYSITPSAVFIETITDLSFTVENPPTGSSVSFTGSPGGGEITVSIPIGLAQNGLTNQTDFSCTALNPEFTCVPSPVNDSINIVVTSLQAVEIAPGSTLEFQLRNVAINAQAGIASVNIQENIGGSAAVDKVCIAKVSTELTMLAYLGEENVSPDSTSALLHWVSTGAQYVEISGFLTEPGTREFPVTCEGPCANSVQVHLSGNQKTAEFTLTAVSETDKSKPVVVPMVRLLPIISSFTASKTGTIPVDESVELSGETEFATEIWMEVPGAGSIINFPGQSSCSKSLQPGMSLASGYADDYMKMPAEAEFTLVAKNTYGTVTKTLKFAFEPVQLAYFKDNWLPLKPLYETTPLHWPAVLLSHDDHQKSLSIIQPGGNVNVWQRGQTDNSNPLIEIIEVKKIPLGLIPNVNFICTFQTYNLASITMKAAGNPDFTLTIEWNDVAVGKFMVNGNPDKITWQGKSSTGVLSIFTLVYADIPF